MKTDTQDRRAGSGGTRWRGVVFFLPVCCTTVVGAGLIALCLVLFPAFRERQLLAWIRCWGRLPLWMLGVRLELRGLEHRDAPGPKLLLFNHVSLLDIYVLAALAPERPLVLYKREFHRIPGLGWALRAAGMIPIDRADHEAAMRSMALAGRRLQEEGSALMVAPEGTRSRRGGLQPFKPGAFHLAAQTGAPIVPMLMQGVEGILPMGSWVVRAGRVRVDYLPPIETTAWSAGEARRRAEETREIFLEQLEGEPPSRI